MWGQGGEGPVLTASLLLPLLPLQAFMAICPHSRQRESLHCQSVGGISLAVRGLGLCTFTAEAVGSIPGRGTKIPTCLLAQKNQHPNIKQKQYCNKFNKDFKKMLKKKMSLAVGVGGTSLAIQWLGVFPFTAEGVGSIPGQGTKIPQVAHAAKKKKKCQWDLVTCPLMACSWLSEQKHLNSLLYLTECTHLCPYLQVPHPPFHTGPAFPQTARSCLRALAHAASAVSSCTAEPLLFPSGLS